MCCCFLASLLFGDVQANSSVNVDISVFHDALAPYGNWVNHPTYGQVWYPRDVAQNWRPYTDGYWAHTDDYGWLWVSYEPWGWAPFHYGRWAWDNWYGWVWVPGRTWAPAWVFWRSGGGYAAWAPMPPNVVWRPGIGLNISYFNDERDLSWDSWVAVREYDLPHRHLSRHICPPRENPQIINVTNYTNNVTIVNNTIVNRGVPVRQIENITRKPVERIVPKVHNKAELNSTGHQGGQPSIVRLPMASPTPEEIQNNEELARRLDGKRPDGTRADIPKAHSKKSGDFEPKLPGRLTGITTPAQSPEAIPEAPPVSRDPELNGHRNGSADRKNQKALLSAQPSDQQSPSIQAITPVYPQADGVSDTVPVINPESVSTAPSLQNQPESLDQLKKSDLNPVVDRQQIEKRDAENLQLQPVIDPSKQKLKSRQEKHKRQETEMQQTVESSRQEPQQMQQQEAARAQALENQQQLELQQQQTKRERQEARQMQQQEAARAQALENQQQLELQQQQAERARQEAQQMQQQEAARAQALENQQQLELQQQQAERARQEAQQMQQQEAARAQALENQQQLELQQQQAERARQEAQQMQQQEAGRAQALENQQQLELQQQQAERARQEAQQMQQQEAARAQALENQQQLELQQQQAERARQEAQQMQQQEAGRAQALENQRQLELQQQQAERARQEAQQMQQHEASRARH